MQDQDCATGGYDDDVLEMVEPDRAPAQLPAGPGLHLMTRADLDAAVGDYSPGRGGDWEDSGASSREEAVRLQMLARYRDDPDLVWRRHLVADDALLARLSRLAAQAPNIARAVEVVRRAAILSRHGGTPLQVPPIVLVGPPGCGKTRYATALAHVLGVTSTTIVGSTITDMGKLIGYHPSWKGAAPGLVAKSLLSCQTSSPVIVVDEAEKISAIDGLTCPLNALLTAMDPSTAQAYRDGYYDVPMHAGHLIWLLCINDTTGLSEPLLDRCVVIEVSALSGAERHQVLDDLAADILLDHGIAPSTLGADALAVLDGIGLRRARAVVSAALAGALETGRDILTAEDLRIAVALLGGEAVRQRRRTAGFVQF